MPTLTRHRRDVASHRRRPAAVLFASALVVLLTFVAGACSSSSNSASTTTTTTTAATTSTTAANPEAAVTQTVQGWVEAFSRAREAPAGDHRELLGYGTADFAQKQEPAFESFVRDGQRIARPADSKQMLKMISVTVHRDRATAKSCFVDDIEVVNTQTGKATGRQTGTLVDLWFLERAGSRWLITRTQTESKIEGVQPCPSH